VGQNAGGGILHDEFFSRKSRILDARIIGKLATGYHMLGQATDAVAAQEKHSRRHSSEQTTGLIDRAVRQETFPRKDDAAE